MASAVDSAKRRSQGHPWSSLHYLNWFRAKGRISKQPPAGADWGIWGGGSKEREHASSDPAGTHRGSGKRSERVAAPPARAGAQPSHATRCACRDVDRRTSGRQHSSGGKNVLLGITKRGDRYLRSLLVHGARSVVVAAKRKNDPLSRWANRLRETRGPGTRRPWRSPTRSRASAGRCSIKGASIDQHDGWGRQPHRFRTITRSTYRRLRRLCERDDKQVRPAFRNPA